MNEVIRIWPIIKKHCHRSAIWSMATPILISTNNGIKISYKAPSNIGKSVWMLKMKETCCSSQFTIKVLRLDLQKQQRFGKISGLWLKAKPIFRKIGETHPRFCNEHKLKVILHDQSLKGQPRSASCNSFNLPKKALHKDRFEWLDLGLVLLTDLDFVFLFLLLEVTTWNSFSGIQSESSSLA